MSNKGRIDGSGMINNVNVFAALSSSRNRKPKGKSSSSRKSEENGIENVKVKVVEETTFWAPAPLNVKSWADVDDDDDYYATTVPPQAVWGLRKEKDVKDESLMHVEEIESDEDVLGEVDDELDEEHESEPDVQEDPKPVIKCFTPAIVFKEPEKQLSKKEIRKKELEELDALLADLNITPNDKSVLAESQGAGVEKVSQLTVEEETSGSGPAESKNSKKKKAKSSKDDAKDIQTHTAQEEYAKEDAATVDVKEQLKKLAAAKKKKQSKETDTAAKAAAAEAAARRQKLEAAKKKEKSHHYNQQPVR